MKTTDRMGEMKNEKQRLRNKYIKIGLLSLFILWAISSWIPVTERISLKIPGKVNEEVRIALITDLHSCYYGKDQEWLIRRVDRENPDVVVLGGDIFDDRLKDDNAKIAIRKLAVKYPVFYVTGNHEYWSRRVDEMKESVRNEGVPVLEGDCETISVKGTTLDICGVDDPTYMTDNEWNEQLQSAYDKTDRSHVKILVSHRPERVSAYEKYDYDLVLTGHAHAGQFRIPFINRGILAPDQGLMAEYVRYL